MACKVMLLMLCQVSSMVHGYHKYQHICDAVVGEILSCSHEMRNIHDPYAVSIKKGGMIAR